LRKKVYLDVTWATHSLFRELISYPPEGYAVITDATAWGNMLHKASRIELVHALKRAVVDPLLPLNLIKSLVDRFVERRPPDAVLTYASQHIVLRPEPWVVDVELVHALAGGGLWSFQAYKGLIERALTSPDCKRIITWTEAGKRTVLENLNGAALFDKIEIVYLARHANAHFPKAYGDSDKVKLLFVNSANLPGQFEIKGGHEVIGVFKILRTKYDNVELSELPRCRTGRGLPVFAAPVTRGQKVGESPWGEHNMRAVPVTHFQLRPLAAPKASSQILRTCV
jgi:hypothetical protein